MIHTPLFQWLLFPLAIFLSKLVEVSIGTLRLIFLARKDKKIVPLIAFVEVFIWIVTIGIIVQNLTNIMAYVAYAAGFAAGNYSGILIEEKMALGNSLIRVITRQNAQKLIAYLKKEKYSITTVAAKSNKGNVNLIYILVSRRRLKEIVAKIKRFNPRAFFSVEDVSVVSEGIMPIHRPVIEKTPISGRLWGKGK